MRPALEDMECGDVFRRLGWLVKRMSSVGFGGAEETPRAWEGSLTVPAQGTGADAIGEDAKAFP